MFKFWAPNGWIWFLVGWGFVGALVGAFGSVSQAREKLLFPPGAWWTLTEVVPYFVKSIYWV